MIALLSHLRKQVRNQKYLTCFHSFPLNKKQIVKIYDFTSYFVCPYLHLASTVVAQH